jgi:hypothetical protein
MQASAPAAVEPISVDQLPLELVLVRARDRFPTATWQGQLSNGKA